MAVVALTTIEGDRTELLRKYDQVSAKVMASPPAGLLTHTCVELDKGIRIASVYETEQQARAFFASAIFQQAVRDAGLTAPQPEIFRVHKHVVTPAAVTVSAAR
jgi:hypothetical protein